MSPDRHWAWVGAAALACGFASACTDQPAPTPYWEDPAVFAENREPPRASFTPFATVDAAVERRPEDSPLPAHPERRLAIPLGAPSRRAPDGLLRGGLRRVRVGRHPRSEQLGVRGLWVSGLPRRVLLLPPQPPRHPGRRQPGGIVSADVRASRGLGRARDLPALRRGLLRVFRVGERRADRVQRGQPDGGGVPGHGRGAAGDQRGRGRGLPVERRQLPGEPGLLAHQRDRPGRVPGRDAGDVSARLLRRGDARRRVRGRGAAADRERRESRTGDGRRSRGALRVAGSGGAAGVGRAPGAVAGGAGRRRGGGDGHDGGGATAAVDRGDAGAVPAGHVAGGTGGRGRRRRCRPGSGSGVSISSTAF